MRLITRFEIETALNIAGKICQTHDCGFVVMRLDEECNIRVEHAEFGWPAVWLLTCEIGRETIIATYECNGKGFTKAMFKTEVEHVCEALRLPPFNVVVLP